MRLIKLDAIDSTNDFLKKFARENDPDSFTVVTTKLQTNGRGQMGAKWESEEGKNLITSIFIKDALPDLTHIYNFNIAVTTAVSEVLESFGIENISIKWPNDIMAENRKCGGILIENIVNSNGQIHCIAGIGINVNQEHFEKLPGATSLKIHTGKTFDVDELLNAIVAQIKINTSNLTENSERLLQKYYTRMFKKDVPMAFRFGENDPFMGIVRGINASGSLLVELENGSVKSFGLKEISMLY